MSSDLIQLQSKFTTEFHQYSDNYFKNLSEQRPEVKTLWDSLKYSFDSGGKRFRPFVASLVATAYNQNYKKIIPYALAVEMIHSYSLIHDDLPCMDNDDFRRGKPTNHKVYGEDIALLAGDAFLTQSFSLLADAYSDQPKLAVQLISLLSKNAGALGMIAGQVMDMKSHSDINLQQLEKMHQLKTGALIEAAVTGSALILETDDIKAFTEFGKAIGLAFQIKDDILDANDKAQDYKSFIAILGLEKTKAELQRQSQSALSALEQLKNLNTQALADLVHYNQTRNT